MPHLSCGEVKLHYTIRALNHENSAQAYESPSFRPRPRVVLIHGLLFGNLASWYFGVAHQLEPHFDVLLYDLRGHGLSETPKENYTLNQMVQDLHSLLDQIGWHAKETRPISIIGHSYGGLIALKYASIYPEYISTVGVIDTPRPPSQLNDLLNFGIRLADEGEEALIKEILTSVPTTISKHLLHGRRGRKLRRSWQTLLGHTSLLVDLASHADIHDLEIKELTIPCLAIYGTESNCLPSLQLLEPLIHQGIALTLKGGHFLLNEHPIQVGQWMNAFLCTTSNIHCSLPLIDSTVSTIRCLGKWEEAPPMLFAEWES